MSKYSILTARRLEERRVWAAAIGLVLILSGSAMFLGFEGLGSTHNSTLTGSVPLSSTVNSVWGINGTGSGAVYEQATLVSSGTKVTATFKAGFEPTHIVAFQRNSVYDIEGILNTSYYYQQLNVQPSDTGTNVGANLVGVYAIVGTIVNDTSLKSIKDKGFSDVALNQTWYNSNTNNLNKTVGLNLLGLAKAKWTTQYVGYIINENYSKTNTTGVFSVIVTQQFERPFTLNLIKVTAEIMAVVGFIAVLMLVNAMPRKHGGGY